MAVYLNYNLNYKNYDEVEALILTLKKEKIKFPLYFSDVFDCEYNKENNSYEEKAQDYWVTAHKLAMSYGYKYKPFYRSTFYSCGYNRKNTYNISPTGSIYCCISGMENEKYKRGNIKENKELKHYKSPLDQDCLKCKFLIRCGGGCNFTNDLKGKKDCLYKRFESEELELLSLYITENFE